MEQGQKKKVKTNLETLRKLPSWSNETTALLVEEIDKVFWKSSRKTEFADVFCKFGGPELFISILRSNEYKGLFTATGAWEASFIVYNSLYNISEASEKLSGELGKKGMVKLCANNIVRYREKTSLKDIESLVHISLSLLCNLSTWPRNRHIFREEGVLAKMEPYTRMDARLKTICMITSAYIIEESQEENSDGKSGSLAAQRKSIDWTSEEIGEWLSKQGLERWRPALLHFSGKSLHNLCKLRHEAPEFFYRSIQDDEALQRLNNVFKFTEALDALNE